MNIFKVTLPDLPGTDHKNNTIHAGFSLVELVIVISLISIISGLGFISLRDYSVKQQVSETTNDIITSLRLARSRAQTQVKDTNDPACQDNPLEGYEMAFTCQSNDCGYMVYPVCGGINGEVIRTSTFPADVTVSAVGSQILFRTLTGTVEGIIDVEEILISGKSGEQASLSVYKDGRITHEK